MVENSTLSAVLPPDVTYNLAMPASILSEGKLSNLQLEAIVYGCQRHLVDLPMKLAENRMMEMDVGEEHGQVPLRAGEFPMRHLICLSTCYNTCHTNFTICPN